MRELDKVGGEEEGGRKEEEGGREGREGESGREGWREGRGSNTEPWSYVHESAVYTVV